MKRIKRDGGVRGVAWVMGGPPNTYMPTLLIAVAGATVYLRHPDGKWRSGMYANGMEAEKGATHMTAKQEGEGKHLINGPVEFAVDHDDPEADTLHNAILAALNLV